MAEVRDKKTKAEFVKYLKDHPEERFWQAIRNFSGWAFVCVSDQLPTGSFRDTFNWESDLKKEEQK